MTVCGGPAEARRPALWTLGQLLGLALLVWGCPYGPPPTCSVNEDCEPHQFCRLDICLGGDSCVETDGCPASQVCVFAEPGLGRCVECSLPDLPCPAGLVCGPEGRCRSCNDDSECPAGAVCASGTCHDTLADLLVNGGVISTAPLGPGEATPATDARFGHQYGAAAAAAGDRRVVVWRDDKRRAVVGQKLDASLAPEGDPFVVGEASWTLASDPPPPYLDRPDVSSDESNHAVVWVGPDPSDPSTHTVLGRLFRSGVPDPIKTLAFVVDGIERSPRIGGLPSGYVVVWVEDPPGAPPTVVARIFDDDLEPLFGPFPVSDSTFDSQESPDVAVGGSIYVVWDHQDGPQWEVRMSIFDLAGAPLVVDQELASTPYGGRPAVAWGAQFPGPPRVAVVWNPPGSVRLRLKNHDGTDPPGGEIIVGLVGGIGLSAPDVAVELDRIVVVWDDNSDVLARRFNAAGAEQDSAFRVNQFTPQDQRDAVVIIDPFLDELVVWRSELQDGSGHGIFAAENPIARLPGEAGGPIEGGAGFTFGTGAQPIISLASAEAGESPRQTLRFTVNAGDLEAYEAIWSYPPEFGFNGFLALGPPGTSIGSYGVDFDGDGVPELYAEIRSDSDHTAFVDHDGDGSPVANPPLVHWGGTGIGFALYSPFGDGDPTTLFVPLDAEVEIQLFPGILVNPVVAGTWEVESTLISVDPDSGSDDDGVGESPLTLANEQHLFTVAASPFFADGFESGDLGAWSGSSG